MSKAKTFMLDQTGANTEEILKWDGSQWNPSNTLSLGGDLTVTGDLTVNGTTTTLNTETVLVEDNIITVNNGEAGAGVTAGSAGIEVDRGTETPYEFKFVEATDDFRIGETGSLQSVATREDTPTDNGVAFWDNATSKFETSAALTYNGNFAVNTDALYVDTANNRVGIGTTSPSAKLQSSVTDNSVMFRAERTGLNAASIEMSAGNRFVTTYQALGAQLWENTITDASSSKYQLSYDGTTHFNINGSTGNVGIGTSAPTAKLHIGGTSGVDGIRFPDGTLQTTASTGGSGSTSKGFKAYLGSNQSVSANTITVLDLDTEVYDTEGWFNTSTNRFQPDEAGTYLVISGCVSVDVNSNSEYIQCLPRLNGTTTLVTTTNYGGTSGFTSAIASTTVVMNGTTDYLQLACRHNITGNISSGEANTFMAVHKLG